jgi:cation:H+ antiporter
VDFAYSEDSVYHALTGGRAFIITLTLLLSTILVMGLLDRERYGIGGIGWESF